MLSIIVEGEPQTISKNKERYVWGKANMTAIKDNMDGADCKKEMSQRTVDEAWNFLTTTLQETVKGMVSLERDTLLFLIGLNLIRKTDRYVGADSSISNRRSSLLPVESLLI
jgi:hypothetical protein